MRLPHSNFGRRFLASSVLASLPLAAMPLFATEETQAIHGTETTPGYEIVGHTIPQPLTSTPGDSARGLAVFLDRNRGHCLLCHAVNAVTESSQGNIGPALDNVGDRLGKAALRLRIVDGTTLNPNTAMPAYYRTAGLHQVGSAYLNKPVLNAQEVEDVVAWLTTLRATDAN